MPKFYTSVILLINQSKEIGEKPFLVFVSRGGQNSPLMHVPFCVCFNMSWPEDICFGYNYQIDFCYFFFVNLVSFSFMGIFSSGWGRGDGRNGFPSSTGKHLFHFFYRWGPIVYSKGRSKFFRGGGVLCSFLW